MAVPEGFPGGVDVLRVSGRHGTFLIESQISFGPFRTVYIRRGISSGGGGVGNGAGLATGLSSEHHSSDRQGFDFVLQGPGAGPWRGKCVAFTERDTKTEVTGVHVGTEGAGLARETTESVQSGYTCELDGPDAEHWKLEADERLEGGTVKDAAGAAVADISPTGERMTWHHPALDGNTVTGPDGRLFAAVQRSFDGAVYLSRDLDPKRKAAVAAICTALLIPDH
jgi:hypothetical protein